MARKTRIVIAKPTEHARSGIVIYDTVDAGRIEAAFEHLDEKLEKAVLEGWEIKQAYSVGAEVHVILMNTTSGEPVKKYDYAEARRRSIEAMKEG